MTELRPPASYVVHLTYQELEDAKVMRGFMNDRIREALARMSAADELGIKPTEGGK